MKIWEHKPPGTLWATPGLLRDEFTFRFDLYERPLLAKRCQVLRIAEEVKTLCERHNLTLYQGADKSLARPASRCILFDGENISFDASLLYI